MFYAKELVELHERLLKSGFFKIYESFNMFRIKNHLHAAAWVDVHLEVMRNATRNHFLVWHGQKGGIFETDFHFSSTSRPDEMRGSRIGIIVSVQLYGEEQSTKYSVKCHNFGSLSFLTKGFFLNIKEIFCYKLLELIKVGPVVRFILPNEWAGSKTAM